MANSAERRRLQRLMKNLGPQAPTPVPVPQASRTSVSQRLLDFVEQPYVTVPIGIVGGIAGVLIYAPVLVFCGLSIVLGFHRAKVVSDRSVLRVQLPAYVALVGLVSIGLFYLHVVIQRQLRDANISISNLIANAVVKSLGVSEQPQPEIKTTDFPSATEIAEEVKRQLQNEPRSTADGNSVMWGRDELRFGFHSSGRESARNPKWWSAVLDFSNPYYPPNETMPQFVPTIADVDFNDFVRPGDYLGTRPVINTPEGTTHVKQGDILSGVFYLTCENCSKVRAYYFYFVVGRGGWYAEAQDWKKIELPSPLNVKVSYDAIQRYEDKLVPINTRTQLPEYAPNERGGGQAGGWISSRPHLSGP
jgi:hypothetical protein